MPHVDSAGVRISYEVVAGDGPPLVLHHGLSDSGRGWHETGYVDELRRYYTLVLVDARGHGQTAKPHATEAYHPAELLASDVLAVLDALFVESAHFFGYSLGGRVGFELARLAPGRLRSLVLGGAHPYAASLEPFRQLLAGGLTAWVAAIEQLAGPLPHLTQARLLANDAEAMRAVVAKDWDDIARDLADMTVPCRLYVGADDPIVALVQRCARELPGTTSLVLPKFNHFSLFLQGAQVLPLILSDLRGFLAGAEAQAEPASTPRLSTADAKPAPPEVAIRPRRTGDLEVHP